jgi:serine protease Do
MKPGTQSRLELWRDGGAKEVAVTVGEAKDAQVAEAPGAGEAPGKLGVAVRPLTSEERKENGGKDGLVVESVSGAAARAGIQRGDVILAVNGTPIKDVGELRRLIDKSGKSIAVLVQREDAQIYVPVNIG